ncbi:hypothetical protein HGM15179_017359 [Zosterops borbonicus]|uniref:NAD(P)(+)--arginine ADP-ribosyltransferase n=1 Tax=Zosterops borbonicus TaxID=364589 RepID=A0A8K1G0Y8_9PASS|nr:hypothetical protein HGM15179_017359 [Zosterops borbonicus]
MAMATVAMEVVPQDMAWSSFDDQYLNCSVKISKKFHELQQSDFLKNEKFARNWAKAMAQWQKQGSVSSPLIPDQAIALMAYTMKELNLYKEFNDAMREAGNSSWKYQNEFHFKSLHFLLTHALQKLRRPNDCKVVYQGVSRYQYRVNKDDKVRFGQFASTSLRKTVAQVMGRIRY